MTVTAVCAPYMPMKPDMPAREAPTAARLRMNAPIALTTLNLGISSPVLDLGIHADNGGTDHELEEEQADAAHDEGDPEDALAKQGVGSVIDEDGTAGNR